jgi:hypothetical protein
MEVEMAGATQTKTKAGQCPTHGSVQATKEVPAFKPPGLFWAVQRVGSAFQGYRCPQCGAKV